MDDFCLCDEFSMDDRGDSFGFMQTDAPFPLPVGLGGTGAANAADARENLGINEALKDSVPTAFVEDISTAPKFTKTINGSNAWLNPSGQAYPVMVEIPSWCRQISFTAKSGGVIAFLTSDDTTVAPSFPASYPGRIVLSDELKHIYSREDDMLYMYILKTSSAGADVSISDLTFYSIFVDETLSIQGAAADAKATGDAVNEGKSVLRYVEDASEIILNPVFTQGKNISSSGAFVSNVSRIATKGFIDIANARTANSIPIADNAYKEGISYTIANGYRIYVAYYSEPNESSFVSSEGWLTGSGKLTPTGNYMRLGYATVGDASTMTVAMASNITLKVQYSLKSVLEKLNHWGVTYNGSLTASDDADNIVDIGIRAFNSRFSTNIPKTGSGSLITIPGIGVEAQSSSTITALLQMCIYVDGEIWIRYARYASSSYSWRAWVKIHSGIEQIVEKTKWLAVGDSITYGVYSYIGSGGVAGSAVTPDCWVRLLANSLSYDLTIMASRGMGYTVTGQDPDDSSLPRITLDTLLTRIEAMTNDFNLITLAFGINDYATTTSTVSGVVTSFNDAVERLSEKFPEARLVVITPFNSCRAGTASSNWAYNTASGNKTLKDVADAIAERCSAYGIECIDASNGFLLNSFNIQDLLPDNTHPSLIAHKLIAKNMAHLLLN